MRASAIIKELIAAGVTGDALVTAMERIEVAGKTPGAARQARYRERKKEKEATEESVTSDVTASQVTNDIYTNLPSSEVLLGKKEVVGVTRASKPRATQLPPDWILPDAGWKYASKHGWSEDRTAHQFERFKNHAMANGRVQKNWLSAWYNWVTSPIQLRERSGGTQQDQPNKSVSAYCAALGRRLAERKDTADILSLSQGRLQRPGGFRDAARDEPGAVPTGDRGIHHGPGDGHPDPQQVAAAVGGGGGGVSGGGSAPQKAGEILELAPSRRAIAETPF